MFPVGSTRFIDLTRPLVSGMAVYPGDPAVEFLPCAEHEADGYQLTELRFGTHCGTHLDAPRHYFAEGRTVDQIPLAQLIGPAVVIDLTPDDENCLTVEAFEQHKALFAPGSRVLLRTGWESRWGKEDYFTAHPSLTPEAAQWIVSQGVALLGLDMPSPAVEPEEVHRTLLGGATPVVIVENLVNLAALPAHFLLAVLPAQLSGLDGAPVRAVAGC